jgi:glycosyltransferase involved in cell wall biosynthesis
LWNLRKDIKLILRVVPGKGNVSNKSDMSMELTKRSLAILPAYNEEGSVGKVVQEINAHFPQAAVLVMNDGSTDRTSEKARTCGATVLDLPFNLGIGGAMQAGYKYAYENGYDVAIQVDADGQHDPKEIHKLLRALEAEKLDVAIGSRFLGSSRYKGSFMRRIGIAVFSAVISAIVRQRITDPTSGFRASNRKAIQLFAMDYPQDYPEPEVVILLHQCHLKMGEVSVKMNERFSGESSINTIRSVYYMVKVLLAIFVDCFKKPSLLEQERGRS